MRIQLLGSAALALSLVVAAPAAGNPNAPAKKADPNEKIICKTEGTVGSRIRDRVCKTRAEWELSRTKAREAMDSMPKEQYQAPERAGPI